MQSKRWSLRLDEDTRKLLDLLAEQMQRSRASVIKVLIRDAAKPLQQSNKKTRKPQLNAPARS